MSAHASGLEVTNVGSTESGPATWDAASIHHNPAGMAMLPRTTVMLTGGMLVGGVGYTRERLARYPYEDSFDFALPLEESGVDDRKTGVAPRVGDNPVAPLGDAFAVVRTGPLALGLGFYVPYAAVVSLDPDGPQRWVMQDVSIIQAAITPALAVQLHPRVSLGVSVPIRVGRTEFGRVQDFAEIGVLGEAIGRPPIDQPNSFGPEAQPGVREIAVLSRPTVIRNAWAVQPTVAIGVAAQPTDTTQIGASITLPTEMVHRGSFTLDMDVDFFTQDLASQGLQYPERVRGDASLGFTLPMTVRAGIRQQVAGVHHLTLDGAWVGWSSVDAFDLVVQSPDLALPRLGLPDTIGITIPRRWRDTMHLRAMHSWRFDENWRLWWGAGLRTAASPDEYMDLAAIDGLRVQALAGLSHPLSDSLTLQADVEVQTIGRRTVLQSRHDIGNGVYSLTLARLAGRLIWRF
jgi:long-chain fatty acid transport protein